MIVISDRKMLIPAGEDRIGYQGDHNAESVIFRLPLEYKGIDMTALDYRLDTQFNAGKDVISLSKSVSDYIYLTWTIEESHILSSGLVLIQVRGFNGAITKWVSASAYVSIGESILPQSEYPDPLPSEFAQMEARVTDAKDTAVEAAGTATAQAETAANKANEVKDLITKTPYVGENGNWYEWQDTEYIDTGVAAQGPQGIQGIQGTQGIQGERGEKGDEFVVQAAQPAAGFWMEVLS